MTRAVRWHAAVAVRILLRVLAILFAAWLAVAIVLFVVHHDDAPAHADAVVVLQGSKTRLPRRLQADAGGVRAAAAWSRAARSSQLEHRLCDGETALRGRLLLGHARPAARRGSSRGSRASGDLDSLDVVTSQFHVFRARRIFERCYDGELRMVGSGQTWWLIPKYMVDETAKLAYQSCSHAAADRVVSGLAFAHLRPRAVDPCVNARPDTSLSSGGGRGTRAGRSA